MFDEATTNTEPHSFNHLPVLSKESEELRWFLMPNEAQEYLTGARTTPLTNRSFQPKFYPKHSLKKGLQAGEASPDQQTAAGVTGPRRGRVYKITPSASPTPPDLPNEHLNSDISEHMGSFMAEVEPTGKDDRISLGRIVSIRLHVAEEAPVISKDRQGGEGQAVTTTNFKRWVSTDALHVQRSDRDDNTSTTQSRSSVEGMLPSSGSTTSSSRGRTPNRFPKEGKVGIHSEISENGSVLNNSREAKGKRLHAKKRWKIKKIFGIKN